MENKINNLPHEDGTTVEETKEKEKAELDKEFNKAMDSAEKAIDEINTAEAKVIKEKLTLDESDAINEGFLTEDGDFISDVYDALSEVAFNYKEVMKHMSNKEIEDDFQEAFDYFLVHFIDDDVNEEIVDEAVPKDLVSPFKHARLTDRGVDSDEIKKYNRYPSRRGYKSFNIGPDSEDGLSRKKLDFQNSDYTPITPEEAIALKKNGEADKVLAVLDGQLVSFNKEGKQIYRADRQWGSDSDKFTRPNGDVMPHSGKLTFATVVNKADKIYKADEVDVPDEVLKVRRSNPESKGFDLSTIPSTNIRQDRIGTTGRGDFISDPCYYSSDSISTVKYKIETVNNKIKEYEDMISKSSNDGEKLYYSKRIDDLKQDLAAYQKRLRQKQGVEKDGKARRRYLSSENEFRKVFDKFNGLKNDVFTLKREADRYTDNFNKIKANGSEETRSNKEKLARLQADLKHLMRSITEVEILLDGCGENDAEELAEIQDKLNDATDRYMAKQGELNAFLGKNKAEALEEDSQLSEEEIPALNKIKEAGKISELNDLISELYPEGITDDQLKDILTYEQDYILDTLGIGDEDND